MPEFIKAVRIADLCLYRLPCVEIKGLRIALC